MPAPSSTTKPPGKPLDDAEHTRAADNTRPARRRPRGAGVLPRPKRGRAADRPPTEEGGRGGARSGARRPEKRGRGTGRVRARRHPDQDGFVGGEEGEGITWKQKRRRSVTRKTR